MKLLKTRRKKCEVCEGKGYCGMEKQWWREWYEHKDIILKTCKRCKGTKIQETKIYDDRRGC